METVEHLAERSPHILGYVRTLGFISHQSNHEEEGLSSILLKFDNVQHLLVEFCEKSESWDEPYSWNSFPQRYQLVLSQLIHHRPLQSLSLVGLGDVPVSILISCRHLNALALAHCHMPSNTMQPILPDTSMDPLPLRELTIKSCGIRFAPLFGQHPLYCHPVIDPTKLEILKLKTANPRERPIKPWDRNIFKQVSNLKSLCILDDYLDYPAIFSDVLRNLHPDSHASLVNFEYNIGYAYETLEVEDTKSFASNMLRDLKFPSLQKLKLYFREVGGSQPEAAATLLLEEYKALDFTIGGPHFPSLKEVYILVAIAFYFPGPQAKICHSARDTHFPRILSNPSIEFNYDFKPWGSL